MATFGLRICRFCGKQFRMHRLEQTCCSIEHYNALVIAQRDRQRVKKIRRRAWRHRNNWEAWLAPDDQA